MAYECVITALADPTRRVIIDRLRGGALPVGAIARGMSISRPAVSQHLRVLSDAGLLTVTPSGNRRLYAIAPDGVNELRRYLDTLWDDALAAFARAATETAREKRMHNPINKTLSVPLTPPEAFALFTDQMDSWWPTATHSVNGETAEITFPTHKDDDITETTEDGEVTVWGTLLAYDPGAFLAFTWHPGRPASEATVVTVTFTATAKGTRCDLMHGGFTILGDTADAVSTSYLKGWDMVLGCFASAVPVLTEA